MLLTNPLTGGAKNIQILRANRGFLISEAEMAEVKEGWD
jgi:hypothetical protein